MRQSRFTEEKIIAVLAEQERGLGTAEIWYQISRPTHWRYRTAARFAWGVVSSFLEDLSARRCRAWHPLRASSASHSAEH